MNDLIMRKHNLDRAVKIHQLLERIGFLSSKEFIQKVAKRRGKLIRQRAVANIIANYYRELDDKVGSVSALFNEAQDLRSKGLSQEEVKEIISFELNNRLKKVKIEPYNKKMSVVADVVAGSYLNREVKKDRDEWLDVEDRALEEAMAEVLASLNMSTRKHLIGMKDTLAERYAKLISDYSFKPELTTKEGLSQLTVALIAALSLLAGRSAQNESAEIEGTIYETVLDELMDERRLITMEDDKVCEICIGNSAVGWIPVDQPYPSGHYHEPIHPECRCYQEGRREVNEEGER